MSAKLIRAAEAACDKRRALGLLRATSAAAGWRVERIRSIDIVSQRPGRRMTLRYVVDAQHGTDAPGRYTLFGKAYSGRRGERVHGLLDAIQDQLPWNLRLPRVIGYYAKRRFLLLAEVSGIPLPEMLARRDASLHLMGFGSALASFHRLDLAVVSAHHDATAEERVLSRAAGVVEATPFSSQLKARFAQAHHATCELLESTPPDRQFLLHRDLHPAQVMVDENFFALVDLDDAARGEAELDVGNFAAHLLLRELQVMGSADTGALQVETFSRAYRLSNPLNDERLRAYTAATLLRLVSLERIARPGISVLAWPDLAAGLLTEAQKLLDSPHAIRRAVTSVRHREVHE